MEHNDEFWMKMAIDLAREGGSPFGAVLVDAEGNHVGALNTVALDGITAHAEINTLKKMKDLDHDTPGELTLYSTVEPCPMCMSAIIWAEIGRVVYGADIGFAQTQGNQITITCREIAKEAWYSVAITGGLLEQECQKLFD